MQPRAPGLTGQILELESYSAAEVLKERSRITSPWNRLSGPLPDAPIQAVCKLIIGTDTYTKCNCIFWADLRRGSRRIMQLVGILVGEAKLCRAVRPEAPGQNIEFRACGTLPLAHIRGNPPERLAPCNRPCPTGIAMQCISNFIALKVIAGIARTVAGKVHDISNKYVRLGSVHFHRLWCLTKT